MPETSTPATAPIFVTPKEAAELLGVTRPEVYRMLREGDLVGRRNGQRHLVLLASVHMYAYRPRT